MEDEEEAAQLIASLRRLGPEGSGLIIANPVPQEEQLDPKLHDRVLKEGLGELKHRGIRGKSVTPFLLNRFQSETKGESLRVNKQIVRNNARLAARIAVAFATLEAREGNRTMKP
jgi:pseudouridine-5'-phosphate glycosidase